ncbi:MAG TPA: amidohydrolase family protein [Candidatus Binataceae bacterium]|nr:amidohydrolase family protein [Candidatus Binataceae bacterium]
MTTKTKSAMIRERLSHPIVDSDGHIAEFEPAYFDFLKKVGGTKVVDRFKSLPDSPFAFRWHRLSPADRLDMRVPRPQWWVHPTQNTLDRATSSLPHLLYKRLDEMGLDFAIIYPSMGMFVLHYPEPELRLAGCRAYNELHAQIFREYSDRMTPVALIPMHSPKEAIDELEYAVLKLGLKAILMPSFVRRPIPAVARKTPEAARYAYWLDNFCLDSEHDYDPVWAKCLELKVAPTFHSPSSGLGMRASVSNFVYNHIGHFAASADSICKALFLGGVTSRFPDLRFSFMEGGVGWACTLFSDLISHWDKRNLSAVASCDPSRLNDAQLVSLFREHGGEYGAVASQLGEDKSDLLWGAAVDPGDRDEFARCNITSKQDIRDLFVPKFFFGCEGDDKLTALAFDSRKLPMRSRLAAVYSSDIGHFDLPDMRDAACEAYELVEDGLITNDDFRDFAFVNPVRAKTDVNPDFFKGTRIEDDVKRIL